MGGISFLCWFPFFAFANLLILAKHHILLTVVRDHCVLFLGLCFCDVGWLQCGDCEPGRVGIQVAVEASGMKSVCEGSGTEAGKESHS